MRILIFVLVLVLVAACENSQQALLLEEKEPEVISTKLDTNLVVPTNDDRIGWQKPDDVIRMLGDLEGESVADIGAGSGYFAFRLAVKAAKVIALDIDPNMIQLMNAFASDLPESIQNRFETRMAKETDANLEEDEVDNIIIINTLAYIDNKKQYLESLKKGLKKGGNLMIVDYKMKRLVIDAPELDYRIPHHIVENLITEAGYTITASDDTKLEYQYIVVAKY